jgi:signal transduction histidine kinase
MEMMDQVTAEKKPWHGVLQSRKPDGTIRIEEATVSPMLKTDGELDGFVIIKRDITERLALESQLAQAQKLESIGQLAAGIAHEINTPAQYVGDNIRFVRDSFTEMDALLGSLQQLAAASAPPAGALAEALQKADLEFLREEIPKALEQSADGCQRISAIVKAMKEFSHPGADKTPVDLNRAIQSTITVATNEWKYVADIRTELDPALPHVTCLLGEFNQVILNMLVNAAHAITDVVGDGASGKGLISVTTRHLGDFAEICISDTGCGITAQIRERIFDPFFTTKQVGKGTGQGLAIAHDVIVNKHAGTIALESEPGKGSTFIIKLPINPAEPQAQTARVA